jgi:glycosyltransferase A (GT-A) superfamily protein (DUF2064 family)
MSTPKRVPEGARALLMAKAPVPGRVKTRLGEVVGMGVAADLAAAALLDALEACRTAFEHCHLALDGDLEDAVRGDELLAAIGSWTVFAQRGRTFGERLAHAHRSTARPGAVVVQVGMDTPQMTADQLRTVAGLVREDHDAVLGPADDGGWWVLGLGRPAEVLAAVEMSTPRTGEQTRRALSSTGFTVRDTITLRDIDTVADAEAVASAAPWTHFARAWDSLVVPA